jgi:hypothetical protein
VPLGNEFANATHCERARSWSFASSSNCITCRRIVALFDHSSARLLSPVFRTAE